MNKTMIVVINERLMDNHQQELGLAMQRRSFLMCSTTKELHEKLKRIGDVRIQTYPKIDLNAFPLLLEANCFKQAPK